MILSLSLLNIAACPAESVQLYREAGAVHLFTQNTGHVFVMPGISLYNSLLFSMYILHRYPKSGKVKYLTGGAVGNPKGEIQA